MNDPIQTDVPVPETDCRKIGLVTATGLLGSGRIVSTVALVNQGMQKTFTIIGLQTAPLPEVFSGIAAFANGVSTGTTRFNAVYDKLAGVTKSTPPRLVKGQKVVYAFIMGAGILTLVYFVANTFSAIIQLECQYINDEHCKNGFDWLNILAYVPAAVVGALSSGYTYAIFTLPVIKENAVSFSQYFGDFSENFRKENKAILGGISILGLANALSLGATLFFSTSKMLFNLLGPSLSEYKLAQAQVYISVASAIISSVFSWVADGRKLLNGKSEGGFRDWFCNPLNSCGRTVLIVFISPILIADAVSHALNNFPGNIEILDKIFSGYDKLKKGFSIANSLNAGFLYFAFNTRRALNIVANVKPKQVPVVSIEAPTPEAPLIQAKITPDREPPGKKPARLASKFGLHGSYAAIDKPDDEPKIEKKEEYLINPYELHDQDNIDYKNTRCNCIIS